MVGPVRIAVEPSAAVGLREAVQTELAFLRHVHSHADILYDPEVIKLACCRYEYLWLPLLKARTKAVPPVDIAFIWHCHVLSPVRYAAACGVPPGSAPEFAYPNTQPPAAAADPSMRITLTSRTAAITSMRQSILKWAAARPAGKGPSMPPLQHGEELAAAVARHRDFYYQVSLPHYRDPAFIDAAVGRYETFLALHRARPEAVLRPPCDIELVRRAHACMPKAQRGHLQPPPPPGDSPRAAPPKGIPPRTPRHNGAAVVNGHSACAEHGELDMTTRAAFASVGQELFRAGGLFRGVPSRQSVRQREDCCPVAPASGIKVSMGRCEWHAEGSAQSIATPPATISGWKLAKASLLGGGSAGTAYAAAGAPIVLRHREPASLQLHVQVAESQPDGSVKTVAASAKSKLSPVLLMQAGEHTFVVRMQIKLKYAAVRNWLAVVTLHLAGAHDIIAAGVPMASGQLAAWPHVRSVRSACAEVTQPALLLPPSAVLDSGPDVAEAMTFTMNGGDSTAAMRGPPMQVKVTSSTKHLAIAIEVFAGADGVGSAAPAGGSPGGATPRPALSGASSTPAATAHSVNLEQLPAQSGFEGVAAIALNVGAAERAFVLRSADEDWGLLIGRWRGQKLADSVDHAHPGYLAWRLVVLEDPRTRSPDPASHGYAGVVRMGAGVTRSEGKVFCGGSGWAHLICGTTSGQFRFEFDEFSPGPASAREAGRLAALLAALSTAVGLLHVLCMPCTRSAAHPENPLQTLHDVTTDSRGFVASWTNVPHCRLLSGFSLLPTNAYICKRLFTDHASLGVKEHKAMQPWFGGSDEATCAKVGRVFWGGRLADDEAMAALRAAWANAPPSRTSSASLSTHSTHATGVRGGADPAACGACATSSAAPLVRGGSLPVTSSGSTPLVRGGSVGKSSSQGSLLARGASVPVNGGAALVRGGSATMSGSSPMVRGASVTSVAMSTDSLI